MTDVQRSIKRGRIIYLVAALAIPFGAFLFGTELAGGSPLAPVPAACVIALLVMVVRQVGVIRILRARERELNRPRMTPEDYRHLREMEAELGWEPSELPAGMTEPSLEPPRAKCDCGKCDEASREFDAHLREQVIASQGIPPATGSDTLTATAVWTTTGPALVGSGTLSSTGACTCPPGACAPVGVRVYNAGSPVTRYCGACGKRIPPLPDEATWDDVAYPSEASAHFAALARVGRESCIGFCPICAERDRLRGGSGSDWVTVVYHSGTADGAVTAGGGGGSFASACPEPEGIPAAPMIEKMRQELEAQRWLDKERWEQR